MRHRYGPHDLPDPLRRALFPVRTPGLLSAAWYWRYELFAVALPVFLASTVGSYVDPLLWAGAVLGLITTVASSRTIRAWCHARLRVIWVQHRLRVGFREAGLYSARGRLPVLLWTRPQGLGEQSIVYLPPGITRVQAIDVLPVLAAATWARSVEIEPYRDRSHLMTVHMLRAGDTR